MNIDKMGRNFFKILIHHRGTEDTEKFSFFFGGRYRQRKTNLLLPEQMIHRVQKAERFLKIGISRFLKNKRLCLVRVRDENGQKAP
jgi:hypothetical protein